MSKSIRNALLSFVVLIAVFIWMPTNIMQARQPCRSFPETGYQVCDRLLEYWQQNGGISVFGYPIGDQFTQVIEGRQIQVQLFERNRLELHRDRKSTRLNS